MRLLSGSAVLLLLATSLAAQQPTREELTVSLVEVPVYVESLSQRELKALTRADFELFVNGQRQEIEYFDVAPTAASAAAGAEPVSVERRHLTVLVLDNYKTSQGGILRGKHEAKKLIQNAPPFHSYAVASISRNGLEFVTPFTKDKNVLLYAVRTMSTTTTADPFRLAPGVGPLSMSDAYHEMMGDFGGGVWADSGFRGFKPRELSEVLEGQVPDPSIYEGQFIGNASEVANAFKREAAFITGDYDDQQEERVIAQLASVADRIAPFSGTKNVIFLSEMGQMTEDLEEGDARRFRLRMNPLFKMVHDKYREAGVILNTVDVGGLRAPWSSTTAMDMPEVLPTLAEGTGGTAVHSVNALNARQKMSYVLGFQPKGPQKEMNSIKVKVRNVPFGTIVRHRKGYSGKAAKTTGRDDGLYLADILMNDIPQNGISVNMIVRPEPGKTDVAVTIPGLEMLARPVTDEPLLLDSFVYLFNEKNEVIAWTYDRLSVDLKKGEEYLRANDYEIIKRFKLPPGKFSAKSLVRFPGTELAGFQKIDVDVRSN